MTKERQANEHESSATQPACRVLVVDDHPGMRDLLETGLEMRGFAVRSASSADAALGLLATDAFDAVLTDFKLLGMNGLELCERIRGVRPDVPVLIVTAFGSLETAVAAIRAGAYDFITKPIEFDALELALRRAVDHGMLREEVKRLRQSLADAERLDDIVGASPEMGQLFDVLTRIAPVDTTVLLTGETGTGKGLVAQALHRRSPRASGPFVAVNCAALPPTLLESELFGHERGAFTDAKTKRIGLFEQANGGSILLDEIGSMPLELQPKLLRVLEERMVRPIGGTAEIAVDARVMAATNEDLETAIAEGRFREDLYYRLNVVHILVPPLRSRGSDVLLLTEYFLERLANRLGKRVTGITSEAAAKLCAYAWPGNVRELANCIEHAVALTRYDRVTIDDLPERVKAYKPRRIVVDFDRPGEMPPMQEVERSYVMRVLDATKGNKVEAARILGFDRRTLYRKLERYEGKSGSDESGPGSTSG